MQSSDETKRIEMIRLTSAIAASKIEMIRFASNGRYFRNGKFSPHDRFSAVNRVRNGETLAAVAKDKKISKVTLHNWLRNADRIQSLIEQYLPTKKPLEEASTTEEILNKRQFEQNGSQNIVSNKRFTIDYGATRNNYSSNVIDLTSTDDAEEPQYYGLFRSNGLNNSSVPNKSSRLDFGSSRSNDSSNVIDLTESDDSDQLEQDPQSYGALGFNGIINSSTGSTHLKIPLCSITAARFSNDQSDRSNILKSSVLNHSQNKGLWKPYADG